MLVLVLWVKRASKLPWLLISPSHNLVLLGDYFYGMAETGSSLKITSKSNHKFSISNITTQE